ncbi:MAG: GGDEF domain-containing protein [Actinoplanes sp.]
MLLRGYSVLAAVLAGGYLLWPESLSQWPFLLLTLVTMPAVVIGLRRAPAGARGPGGLLLAGLSSYNFSNLWWIWLVSVPGHAAGDGTATGLLTSGGHLLVLTTAIVVVFQRGKGDAGGVIDSVITGVALGGLLWNAVLLPAMTAREVPVGEQIAGFVNVFMLTGALGALVRISLVASRRVPAVHLLTAGIAFALIANVAGALAVDAAGVRADWTYNVYLFAYAALGCAALHPSVSIITQPGRAPADRLTSGRLAFLGLMLLIAPLVGGVRVMLGLPADGVLIALSALGLAPLAMVRIGRLARARRAAEHALHRLATSDALTGLPNRPACLDHVAGELTREPDGLVVLFCDLDGFKPVNDRLGHAAGDELLVEVADRLRGCVREGDQVSRLGGDEFVIVSRGPDAVEAISDRIRDMVARPFRAGGEDVRIGVSVGAASSRPGDSTDDLVGRADLAMYEAKRSKAVGALSLATV